MTQQKLDEAELQNAVANGLEAFKDWESRPTRPVVGGSVVRELVIGDPAKSGVCLHGGEIVGLLDLKNARGVSGGACNALIMWDCVFKGDENPNSGSDPGIDASHSHLRRLSLVNCQADGVELSSAVIDGDLCLDGLGPVLESTHDVGSREGSSKRRSCWVKARGVRVGGFFTARGATLSLPPWPPPAEGSPAVRWPPADAEHWRNVTRAYALDLAGAQITGSIILEPDHHGTGFKSKGGVSITEATIGGGFRAAGAHLIAAGIGKSRDALYAKNVRIQGSVSLGHDRGDRTKLAPCQISTVNIDGAVIGGTLLIDASAAAPIELIRATTVRIGGDLKLSGSMWKTDFSGSVIDGQVALGAEAEPPESPPAGDAPYEETPVEQEASPQPEHDTPLKLTRDAVLTLADARVGRDLKVNRVSTPTFPVTLDWTTDPLRIRTYALTSYPGWLLAEALFKPASGSGLWILSFLYRPEGEGRAVILDGESEPIHDLNESFLKIETVEQVVEYLTLFCAHIWADEGAFAVDPMTVQVQSGRSTGSWCATAEVAYGSGVFKATFEIDAKGEVTMVDDEPIATVPENRQLLFATPARWFDVPSGRWVAGKPVMYLEWPVPPPVGPASAWRDEPKNQDGAISRALKDQTGHRDPPELQEWRDGSFDRPNGEWKRPKIDLAGLKVASLDDEDGQRWFDIVDQNGARPKLELVLSGFEYDRISDPERQAPLDGTPEVRSDFREIASSNPDTPSSPSLEPEQESRTESEPEPSSDPPALRNRAAVIPRAGTRWCRAVHHPVLKWHRFVALMDNLPSLLRSDGVDQRRLDARRKWLNAQYEDDPPTTAEYSPQPYQQLARIWRAAGHLKAADDIILEKLKLEKVRLKLQRSQPGLHAGVGAGKRDDEGGEGALPERRGAGQSIQPFWHRTKQIAYLSFVQVPFGFGLKPWRAVGFFVAVYAVGLVTIWQIPLKVDAQAVATVASGSKVVVQVADKEGDEEIACGDHISKLIYPLDVMLPLIDLRQESRCQFSIKNGGLSTAKGLYAIIGWLITSGLILTLSGVVRRRIEA